MTFDMVFGFGIGLLVGMGSACGIMFAVHRMMMSSLKASMLYFVGADEAKEDE